MPWKGIYNCEHFSYSLCLDIVVPISFSGCIKLIVPFPFWDDSNLIVLFPLWDIINELNLTIENKLYFFYN